MFLNVGGEATTDLAFTHRSTALSSMTLSLSVSQDVCPCTLKNALQPGGGGSLEAIYINKQSNKHDSNMISRFTLHLHSTAVERSYSPAGMNGRWMSRPSEIKQTSAGLAGLGSAAHWLSSGSDRSMPDPCLKYGQQSGNLIVQKHVKSIDTNTGAIGTIFINLKQLDIIFLHNIPQHKSIHYFNI